jgi:hypothetical protein
MAIVGGASGNFSSSRPVPLGVGDIDAFGTGDHMLKLRLRSREYAVGTRRGGDRARTGLRGEGGS